MAKLKKYGMTSQIAQLEAAAACCTSLRGNDKLYCAPSMEKRIESCARAKSSRRSESCTPHYEREFRGDEVLTMDGSPRADSRVLFSGLSSRSRAGAHRGDRRNGSGKTTPVKLIVGEEPDSLVRRARR
ncbi:MAG: hypothetical protein ACLUEK_11295 [Oscillospiraceae bacterium]